MKIANPKYVMQPWRRQLLHLAPYIAVCIVFIVVPPLLPSYLQGIMTKILIFAIFAMSLDLIFGFTGLLSLGHAAYFGVGGYTAAALMVRCGINSFWIVAPCVILVTAFVAVIFGYIALRVSGMYFLLVTFALGQLIYGLAWKLIWITGGSDGLPAIPRPTLGIPWLTWNNTLFYYFIFLVFVICFFLIYRIANSPFGDALQGIRENEARMDALGYNIWLCKYVAFIIGGIFAGIAGMLFASYNGLMHPTQAGFFNSAQVWLMVIIGGPGTLWGSLLGSVVIIVVEYVSSIFFPVRWPLVLGVVFVIAVIFLRGGIASHLRRFWKKVSYGSLKSRKFM